MTRWSADAARESRLRPRELAGELAAFVAGLVVLFGAVGIQGTWFTPVEPNEASAETAELRIDNLVWTVFTDSEWPGSAATR